MPVLVSLLLSLLLVLLRLLFGGHSLDGKTPPQTALTMDATSPTILALLPTDPTVYFLRYLASLLPFLRQLIVSRYVEFHQLACVRNVGGGVNARRSLY